MTPSKPDTSPPQPFTATGGARIGWTNATWPLAKLTADPGKLTLSVRILGNYSFAPSEVLSIERHTVIPLLGWGVRIHHCKADCPQRVIFWCLGNPDTVLDGIRNSGFLSTAPRPAAQEQRGIPFRWSVIIVAVLVWNGLFLLASHHSGQISPTPGPLLLLPLVFAFGISLGTLTSAPLQRLILKPGRNVGEIRPFLRLLTLVSGFLLIIFTLFITTGTFNTASTATTH